MHPYRLIANQENITLYTATKLDKIAIARKQTRLFAINKISTDQTIISLNILIYILIISHTESAANRNTCLQGEKF